MALSDTKPLNQPYRFDQKKFQRWVFLLVWPLANVLLVSTILIDLGLATAVTLLFVAINFWLLFGLSFLGLQILDRYFPKIMSTEVFWRQLFVHVVVIIGIAAIFSGVFTRPVALQLSQTLIGPRIFFILQIIIYLIVFRIFTQQERSFTTALALRETELNMLRSQSNPHFLFNTLNLINTQISNDPDNAKEIVYDLADLLRKNINMAQQSFTTLAEEMELVSLYLTLQEKRFKDRLSFNINLVPGTKLLQIPALLLQPVIENTVKYAVAPYASKAHIRVETSLVNGRLVIVVRDSGPAFDETQIVEGNGMRILRKTLVLHYEDDYDIQLKSTASGGVFTLSLPAQAVE